MEKMDTEEIKKFLQKSNSDLQKSNAFLEKTLKENEVLQKDKEILQRKINEILPVYETFLDTETWYNFCETSHHIAIKGYGSGKICALLRRLKILSSQKEWVGYNKPERFTNEPFQSYVDKGYFKSFNSYYDTTTGKKAHFQTRVSARGMTFIHKKILEDKNGK